jgi:phosphatidylinositol glycan class C protein
MSKQPWKKVLYVQQDYEDNYVDETFLNDLEKNCSLYYVYCLIIIVGIRGTYFLFFFK